MRTITLATQKGGTGKSTLAVGLAVAAMQDRERVAIVETDRQGTISKWASRRDHGEPAVEQIADRFMIERTLSVLSRRAFTLVVIDTPGSDSEIVTEAIRLADLCLIPARPSPTDIEATHPTLKAIRRFDKTFAFVLNQAPVRGQRPTRIAETLHELGVLALPYLALRNDHMDALAAGLGVSELAPRGKAAAEIRALWDWCRQRLAQDGTAAEPKSHGARHAVDDNPLHNMVIQSLRLATLPFTPWLRPAADPKGDQPDERPPKTGTTR
jgi:chromosome partitioning protein